eukprot:CAMPEP_0174360686 /NCGR_PEP_ID=MMETSP0811_2-20130205/55537_1 /TAXON_ID=73025 ORGANISM="Eutreptiella gymnastica-like, Strain CCMP1594" /NCGR_SAMPLE_ID=MMETSP0811_2 /ASSEMBLY_ACC=CAM_ASM_000667 /LENGTH=47 /DNA_ID= /DNA_START= /DNA_END= /DNA_ORIENTATION=
MTWPLSPTTSASQTCCHAFLTTKTCAGNRQSDEGPCAETRPCLRKEG